MKCELCGKEYENLISLGRSSFVQTVDGRSVISTVVTMVCEECIKDPKTHMKLMKIEKINSKKSDND